MSKKKIIALAMSAVMAVGMIANAGIHGFILLRA